MNAASRTPGVSGIGLTVRILGYWLWGNARPETLPVPPVDEYSSSSRPRSGNSTLGLANRAAAVAIVALAVPLLVIGSNARWAAERLRDRFCVNPAGSSLLETADAVENGLHGRWWSPLYPSFDGRLRTVASRIREGRSSLEKAFRAYRACEAEMALLGPAGRLLHGRERVEPLRTALEAVHSNWHRQTGAYLAMASAIEPYLDLEERALPKLSGTLTGVLPNHALAFELFDAAGGEVRSSRQPIKVGGPIEMPILAGGRVRLLDLALSGTTYSVVEALELPIERLGEQEIRFPLHGSTLRLRYDEGLRQLVPPVPPLSSGVRAELAP